ncbi:ShlB/FhaC/HecB family hemolysin secretion/activation protein [Waterburya agarophytonicola K14]|uniref:ShlB/FhaC/HecB family hemolysin secretion/activation protein n=1 Tax=Waterburya agarophytonicola KI4 TaxID=2874699 RepID=A0A964BPQ6_9CYAN|nr:ShlB/FhaC/HecB family hemolysin secretion/activation protein [Waterburya agarophytonicola]MCC0175655.1 ShlB/FhaC/HecB family hemolysin secretion/activation protein [Waterburya agarophytonicola KI4]
MQFKNNSGWVCSLFTCQNKDIKFSINTYSWLIKCSIFFVLINNIGDFASCQAQTLVDKDKSTLELNDPKLFSSQKNLPLTISVPTPNSATFSDPQVTKSNARENPFTVRDRPIEVKKIEVFGNSLFKTEIARLTKPFVGKSTNLAQLYQLRTAISQLYTEKGYVNSGAYLPPQKLGDGVVEIKVLEGGIETVEVTGNKHLKDDYIASRLVSIPTPIQAEKLLEQLQLLRLDPLIENVSAELSAGLSPGMSRLDIEVQEADNFTLSSSLNNHNSPSVGSNSRNLGVAHNNLLGFGDRASLNYTNTEGSNGLDFGYGVPINAKNGRISLAYGFNSNDIVEAPFTPLDIQTKSNYYELSLRQPILAKPSQEVALGLSFSRQHSETSLLDEPFPLSVGADESGNTNISALRFFQEFTRRSDDSVVALRSQFSLGVDLFDATINDDAPDGQFFAWRGQSQWARQLDDDFVFLLKGDVQLAKDLVPLEQFRLGGASSVRGYRRDVSLSNSGLLTSAELRVPVLRIQKLDGVFQLVPFVDFGLPWGVDNAVVEIDSLVSIGMGLNFNAGDRFNARLDYGIPLTDIKVEGDSLQEDGLTFSLGHSF